jgi:hypothetical protein
MGEQVAQDEGRLEEAGRRIDELDRKGNKRDATRLRAVHQRIAGDFARLGRAIGDDWHRLSEDAHAATRELLRELDEIDASMRGLDQTR